MKNKNYFILIIILISFSSYSQIRGKIIDKLEREPIPFANITIKGKTFGTVSNEFGEFYFDEKQISENDTLSISHLNYESFSIFNFKKNFEIELSQKEERLNEIVITNKPKKVKERIVGTKTKSGNVILYFVSYSLGGEIGKLIKVKKNTTYGLKNVSFMIYDFGFKNASLRVNFYKTHNGNIEKENCNTNENIITINQKGIVTIDLKNQNLTFNSNFLVSIELLSYEIDQNIPKEKRIIDFSSTVFSGPFYDRNNIHLNWNKTKEKFNIGLGINLLVDSYKND